MPPPILEGPGSARTKFLGTSWLKTSPTMQHPGTDAWESNVAHLTYHNWMILRERPARPSPWAPFARLKIPELHLPASSPETLMFPPRALRRGSVVLIAARIGGDFVVDFFFDPFFIQTSTKFEPTLRCHVWMVIWLCCSRFGLTRGSIQNSSTSEISPFTNLSLRVLQV